MTKEEYIQRINAIRDKMCEEVLLTTVEYLYNRLNDDEKKVKTDNVCIKDSPVNGCVRLLFNASLYHDYSLREISMLRPEVFQHSENDNHL